MAQPQGSRPRRCHYHVEEVKALGMETCMTLDMLDRGQAARLGAAGLDYCNHNIDTSEPYYSEIISTHGFADRLETLGDVREADTTTG
jgi:biotin synthase